MPVKSYKIAIVSPNDGELVSDVWLSDDEIQTLKRLRQALRPTAITAPRIVIYDNGACKSV